MPELTIQQYGMSRHLVIHRRLCDCAMSQVMPRPLRHMTATTLADVLEQVWPHEAPRDLVSRVCLGRCDPPLHIPPLFRTLMRQEPPMPVIAVLVCPDATGKQIVHDPHCDHPARLRATDNGTGTVHLVSSLHALVPLVLPEWPGSVEDAAASEFEIKGCVRNLPTAEPTPVSMATKLQTARKRAYSALVHLCNASMALNMHQTREVHRLLEHRLSTLAEQHVSASITSGDIWEHLAVASECAAWVRVREDATRGFPEDASAQEIADRWVKAATRQCVALRKLNEKPERGGTEMGRAFAEAEAEGRRRFLVGVGDALCEVDALREKAADQAG